MKEVLVRGRRYRFLRADKNRLDVIDVLTKKRATYLMITPEGRLWGMGCLRYELAREVGRAARHAGIVG